MTEQLIEQTPLELSEEEIARKMEISMIYKELGETRMTIACHPNLSDKEKHDLNAPILGATLLVKAVLNMLQQPEVVQHISDSARLDWLIAHEGFLTFSPDKKTLKCALKSGEKGNDTSEMNFFVSTAESSRQCIDNFINGNVSAHNVAITVARNK